MQFKRMNKQPSYFNMLFGSNRRRTWLGIGVQFMQQVTGVNVIMYYAVFLFQQAGIAGTQASLLANGIQGVVLNVFLWPDMYYIDTWGRRTPAILGGFGMGIAMMLIGVLMKTQGSPVYDTLTQKTNFTFANKSASYATIAFVYIYVALFSLTWGCIAWVYPNEVFSMNIRGRGTSLSSATNWFVNFWFALYIPTAMNKISWRLYLIFMALCYAIGITVFLFFPETAKKSLEETDLLFSDDRTIWVFKDREATKVGGLVSRDLERGESIAISGKEGHEDVKTIEVANFADDKSSG
ncbi:hypothetical protein BDY17DRAFT_294451 [Neohortaea acidophila]|uniref:Major facilitator superfamily (MFS) profile domain-containing protein n=1 Tax=Neohortaea acidophila TaxID=245834 RepID=A0A6A6PVH7_9PEZI|nr:uncharacterized protein BDY17DRAFT_294451 [Neohortaea acidophila]KAF2483796.1 hypothetical protein BDY17DRAFT_294451 [Neohortaea acidophila]